MKKVLIATVALFLAFNCFAQEQLAFPFQGGKEVMAKFFKDSITVSTQIVKQKATGTAVFKFTADEKGTIRKIIIYYADDLLLTPPIIEALKKSNHKWIIPDHEKFHDFIIPFKISFSPPAMGSAVLQKALYNFYSHRKPVVTTDQVPLDMATLLPTVAVNYDLAQ